MRRQGGIRFCTKRVRESNALRSEDQSGLRGRPILKAQSYCECIPNGCRFELLIELLVEVRLDRTHSTHPGHGLTVRLPKLPPIALVV